MLTSINPLGERGRGHRWGITMAWLLLGHVLGGLALGGVLALLAFAVDAVAAGGPDEPWRIATVVAVTVGAVVFDMVGGRIPGHRQVDETWLTRYRGWVYGLGFGAQLGFGLVTVINTALVGAMVVAAALAGPTAALAIGIVHGLTRGLAATAGGWVRSIDDLNALHRRLDLAARGVRIGAPALLLVIVAGFAVPGVLS